MHENVTVQNADGHRYIMSRSSKPIIGSQQDFLDLLVVGMENNTSLLLLRDTNFDPAFYDLKTGLAGAILQKVSDYSARLAIVGSFEERGGERFQQLALECNSGTQVRFVSCTNEALSWLLDRSNDADMGTEGGDPGPA